MPVAIEQPPPMPAIQVPAPRPTTSPIEHLSWSGIQDYQTCGKRFFYKRIARVPEERRSSSLIFGSAIHRAAEFLHETRLEGRKLPPVKALLAAFDSAWQSESSTGPEIAYPKDDTAETLRETAERMLAAYRKHCLRQRGEVVAIEHEVVFPLVPGVVPIKARLDLVTVEGDTLFVTDWKTAKCRWSETRIREGLPQLILYAVGASPFVKALGLRRIAPRFVVITKAKKEPLVQTVEPQATQQDVENLKQTVLETADAIRKNVFPHRPSWVCAQCPFSVRCQGQGKGGTNGYHA